jgi:hypothetical protein
MQAGIWYMGAGQIRGNMTYEYIVEQYHLAIAISAKLGDMSRVYVYARLLGHAVGARTLVNV